MKKTLFFLYCISLFFSSLFAKMEQPQAPLKKTICLNMIVKNESKVIRRCLATVKPFIDYWVIVDTGSEDDTKEIIKEFMKDIPGELYEKPFVNFEVSRNHALEKAKGKADYVFIIDADEMLTFEEGFEKPIMDKDYYYIMTKFGGTEYARVQLIKNSLNWKWIGVVHETVNCPEAKTSETLKKINNVVFTDGASHSDPLKYTKHALIFEKELEKDPTHTRNAFYLAQSWRDAGEKEKAIEAYKRRIELGGWPEEVFWSKLQIAHMQKQLDLPPETFLASYYDAYHYRPTRPEPLYYIANYYRLNGNYAEGYLISKVGLSIPPTKDILFVEKWVEDYGMQLENSICAYWSGKYEKCQSVSKKILEKNNIPQSIRDCVERNLSFTRTKLLNLYDPAFNPA